MSDRTKVNRHSDHDERGLLTVLRFVDGKPGLDILIVPLDDERCIVEEVIYDLTIRPSSILVEQSKRCV